MRRADFDREGVGVEGDIKDVSVARTPFSCPFFFREVLGEGVVGAFKACRRSVRALRVMRDGPEPVDSCTRSYCALYWRDVK